MSRPLLDNTIEPDEELDTLPTHTEPKPIVLTPRNDAEAEAGLAGILRQSSHPLPLLVLFLFRIAAILVYILSGWFTSNYVLSTVLVVLLLSMDFWNTRNVAGRRLVGLRYWNQVDEDGESYWVFECRDPNTRPPNPVDSRMFWMAIYVFPALWAVLLVVSVLKLSVSFIPIVILALVFNVTNAVGFTYADRDAKARFVASQGLFSGLSSFGGLGGQLIGGAVGRVFRR